MGRTSALLSSESDSDPNVLSLAALAAGQNPCWGVTQMQSLCRCGVCGTPATLRVNHNVGGNDIFCPLCSPLIEVSLLYHDRTRRMPLTATDSQFGGCQQADDAMRRQEVIANEIAFLRHCPEFFSADEVHSQGGGNVMFSSPSLSNLPILSLPLSLCALLFSSSLIPPSLSPPLWLCLCLCLCVCLCLCLCLCLCVCLCLCGCLCQPPSLPLTSSLSHSFSPPPLPYVLFSLPF